MKVVLRPLPVLVACRGCDEYGYQAREVASVLDRRGEGEALAPGNRWTDEAQLASKARSRFPVFALDGCSERCAARWLEERGVRPQRHAVLLRSAESAEQLARKILR